MADRPTPNEPWSPVLPPILIQPGPLPPERPVPEPSPYRYEPSDDIGPLYLRQRNLQALGGSEQAVRAIKWDRTETRSNELTGMEETIGIDEMSGTAMLIDRREPVQQPETVAEEPSEEEAPEMGPEALVPPEAREATERGIQELQEIPLGLFHGANQAAEQLVYTLDMILPASELAAWLEENVGGTFQYQTPQTLPGQVAAGVAHPITAVGVTAAALPLRALGAVGGFLRWTATGAVADFAFWSPDDPGVAGLAQDLGELDNKTLEKMRTLFVEGLAKDLDDSEIERRLKNVGEGLILGLTVDGLMAMYRAARKIPLREFLRDETGALPGINPVRNALNKKKRRSHRLAVEKQARGATTGLQKNQPTEGAAWLAEDMPAWPRGAPTTDQWIARVEHFLTPEEIAKARFWYRDIYETFEKYVGESKAADLMLSWLIANQNVSPSGALFNALRMMERIRSKVDTGLDAGITTNQLATFIGGGEPQEGIGIKIIDFVDAALQKDTRSAFGDDPIMGSPAVVDVQTLRDMGYTDPTLKRALERRGYAVDDMKLDFNSRTISPSPPQYERAAAHLRALTAELNERGWQGGDLQPAEVQAIGWTAVGQLTSAAESPLEAITKNLRNLSFELDFGPNSPLARTAGEDWAKLTDLDRQELTEWAGQHVMGLVNERYGLTPVQNMPIRSTGGWMWEGEPTTAPNIQTQMLATHEGVEMAANAVGYLMNQHMVFGYTPKTMTTSPKAFVLELVEEGQSEFLTDDASLRTLWKAINDADEDNVFGGFSTFRTVEGRPGMALVVDQGGKTTQRKIEKLTERLGDITDGLPYNLDAKVFEARVVSAVNDWKDNPDGQAYLARLREIGGDRAKRGLLRDRRQFESQVKKAIKGRLKRNAEDAKKRPKGVIQKFLEEEEGGGPSLFPWLEDDLPSLAQPFFSQALKVVRAANMKKGQPQQWLAAMKKGGVKDEEINWLGLPEFLEGKKTVTQEEIQSFVRENQVEIQEVLKGPPGAGSQLGEGPVLTVLEESQNRLAAHAREVFGLTEREARDFATDVAAGRINTRGYASYPDTIDLMDEVRNNFLWARDEPFLEPGSTRQIVEEETEHERYVISGGENYREMVFLWPESPETFKVTAHWSEDNPIAHMRFNERIDDQGRKMLFIEEVQSDWHQAGREGGYKGAKTKALDEIEKQLEKANDDLVKARAEFEEADKLWRTFPDPDEARNPYTEQWKAAYAKRDEAVGKRTELQVRYNQLKQAESGAVPDAPFKKTWQDLVMKRAIRFAAENDFDAIGWTTGRDQAERWDQLQQIEMIRYDPDDGEIQGVTSRGFGDMLDQETQDELRDIYGDILDGLPVEDEGWAYLSLNEPFERGGEGMKAFYDRILVNSVNKFTKKWGARVHGAEIEDDFGDPHFVHAIQITPEMKETALKEGFPLFSVGAGVAGALAASQIAGEASTEDRPGEFQVAGLMDKMIKPLLGRAGREAMERPPPPREPPKPPGIDEVLSVYDPYKIKLGETRLPEVEGLDFNMRNLETTAEVKEIINEVSEAYEQQITRRTGGVEGRVVPLEVTRQVADLLGVDPEAAQRAVRTLPSDVKNLHARALTMRDMLVSSAEEVDRRAFEIAKDPTAVTDQERLAFYEQVRRHAALQANMKGVQTEIARALSSFRIPAEAPSSARAQMVQEALQAAGGERKVEELAKLWLETPVDKRGALAEQGVLSKSVGALREMWINGLLSGPRTHTVNFVSNQLFTLWMIPERAAAAGIGATRRAITGSREGVRGMEAVGMVLGLVEGFPDALRLGWTTFKTETPASGLAKIEHVQHQNISAARWGLDEKSLPGRFVDLTGMGVRIPGRLLMSADEFQKGVGRAMERRAQAYRLAQEDLAQGKPAQDAARTYLEVLEGKNLDAEEVIGDFADTITFTRKLGRAGQSIQRMASQVPAAWLIAPFIRTPTNIMKEFGKRTPLAVFGPEVRADLRAGGARADLAMAKIATGTAAMSWAVHLAAQGHITGGGPSDPAMRANWLQKYSPYSVKVGDKWIPYGRIEPLGMLFGVAADLAEYQKWAPRDIADLAAPTLYSAAVGAMLHRIGERTFFTGLSEFAQAFEDPERYAEAYIRRMAGTFVPYSTLMRDVESALHPARSDVKPDPYERDFFISQFEGILNEWKSRTPGFAKDLPNRLNHWGEEVRAYEGSWVNAFNVFAPRTDKAQPIDEELLRLGYPMRMPGRQAHGIKLNAWQYHNLVKTMNEIRVPHPMEPVRQLNMREYMSWFVGSPTYLTQFSDEHKIDMLKDIRRKFMDEAKRRMITPGDPSFDSQLYSYAIRAGIQKPLGIPFRP